MVLYPEYVGRILSNITELSKAVTDLVAELGRKEQVLSVKARALVELEDEVTELSNDVRKFKRALAILTGESLEEVSPVVASSPTLPVPVPSPAPIPVPKPKTPEWMTCSCGAVMQQVMRKMPSGKYVSMLQCTDCSNERYL